MSAHLYQAAAALIQLIEGPDSGRWELNGRRLKDCHEWAVFYTAFNAAKRQKEDAAKGSPLFAGIDLLAEETMREMPSHMPRVQEEIERRLSQASVEQLVAELRHPSSALQVASMLLHREVMTRVLINTNLG